jgi:hypothetical protein
MSEITTFERWPKQLREKRGLLNGDRVRCARELRGLQRYELARKLDLPAKELAKREEGWCFWEEDEQKQLTTLLDFPLAFFIQEDMPVLAPVFMHGHDEEGNDWCDVIDENGKSMKEDEQKQQAKEQQQADVLAQRMNLGILCLMCGEPCYLKVWYTQGKSQKIKHERWQCHNEEHNK